MPETSASRTATKQRQVADQLLAMHAELEPGAALPPERQLAESFGVSRPTLRSAVDQLVSEGYLERRHGSGTFITHPKVAQPLTLTSFSEDMRRRGLRPGSRILAFSSEFAGAKVGSRLALSPRTHVWAIDRLRLADGEPMAIEQLYLPQVLLPELGPGDLEGGGSLYEYLRLHGVRIGVGTQTIEPTVTTPEESEALRMPVLSPAFLFERVTNSRDGEPIEYVRSIYRGDRYRLLAELRPPFM